MKENIEEDIKIVQEFLIEQNKRNQRLIDNPYRQLFYTDEEVQAIENILSDYKRVLKENKELKDRWDKDTHKLQNDLDIANAKRIDWEKAYQEEKDKQFELVRENQLAKEALKKQCDIADERNQLLRENQKLQKENEELKEGNKILQDCYWNECVSKQKIKDKIEELKEKPLKINENNKYYYETDAYNKIIIQVLQDLLEEKGE